MLRANDREWLVLTAVLSLWFYFQGIRALFSRLFGVLYDALFVGPFSAYAAAMVLLVFAAFLLPPFLVKLARPKVVWVTAGVGLLVSRLALTLENPDMRLYSAIAVVFFGTAVLAILWQARPDRAPVSVVGALALDQFARASGNSLDLTLFDRWLPFQAVLSLLLLWPLVRSSLERTGYEGVGRTYGISRLGAVGLGAFLFLEMSLLDYPNGLARWSGVDYAWVAPLLLFVTALALSDALQTVQEVVLWRIPPGRWLMIILPLLGIAWGSRGEGWIALVGLFLAQFVLLWGLRGYLESGADTHVGWISVGFLIFLVLNFADAFAFTYPYTLNVFRGAGLAIVLIGSLVATLVFLLPPKDLISPAISLKASTWALFIPLSLALVIWWAYPAGVRPPSGETLRMGTYNIHYGYNAGWKYNLPAIADTIEKSGVDVVALQEVDTGRMTSYMVDDALWLARRLKMNALYLPTIEHLTGIALLSRWPISWEEGRLLTSHLEQTGIVGGEIGIGGRRVNVYGVWLGLTPEERANQIREAIDFVEERPGPAALGGDLNSAPDSPVHAAMVSAGFVDPFRALGLADEPTDPAIEPKDRIDYVWLRGLAPLSARVVPTVSSDHRMVAIDARVQARADAP